ncbi:hypothetical protein [Pyrobaculum calidifontis]|uniref:Uncharacterized protein n=1 Tax=Pyrobaculum calidifontis (strain DSM 21063 / JCM 11548 / VA1) TaxID=410359 RepID=A3MST0_PYRCJ|nr:hypothetical protein [Pyrobaculum calidifontis]ABO07697.1 hypothetical protein Pcal_0260 [Pyrobaculum calidifontis JCM 11548]
MTAYSEQGEWVDEWVFIVGVEHPGEALLAVAFLVPGLAVLFAIVHPVTYAIALGVLAYVLFNAVRAARLWARARGLGLAVWREKLLCTPGFVEIGLSGRASSLWANFEPLGGPRYEWPETGSYVVVASGQWIYIRAPGCRVEEGPYRGMVVGVIDPERAYTLSARLSVSAPHGDYARAAVRPAGPGLADVAVEAWLVKARAARLELMVETSMGAHRVTLAESRGGTAERRVDFRGFYGRRVVVVAGTSHAWSLDLPAEGVAGLGWGPSYKLRLVLDMPASRDVTVEEEVTPQPPWLDA